MSADVPVLHADGPAAQALAKAMPEDKYGCRPTAAKASMSMDFFVQKMTEQTAWMNGVTPPWSK
ncbi:hypothetical protein [Gemmatimonas groenlandica]|uniref:Uncharacterized protein n=1 Tax=Gemmatimonas groenlandica TaxID=2732249 RepID=A0A6M4IS96_9BACT|nr:hypothetical protein [Gemmatimonas groenlandica]QJR37613.1 hypothetical protein HKW67_19870 [Gemmatimonas groenlandica]